MYEMTGNHVISILFMLCRVLLWERDYVSCGICGGDRGPCVGIPVKGDVMFLIFHGNLFAFYFLLLAFFV